MKREKLKKTLNYSIALELFSCPLSECIKASTTVSSQVNADHRDTKCVNTSDEIRKLINSKVSWASKNE